MTDELPEDLDVTAYVGPYTFPNPLRRRWIGAAFGLAALAGGAVWLAGGPGAIGAAAAFFAGVAVIHLLTGWPLKVRETEALVAATRAVGFPVGHASAQLVFRGLRSRPTWRILLYSADDPPTKRGLVELDARDGAVLGQHVEDNPEDWSDLSG
ncbi:MAG: hypothetical protein HYU28_06650 [Actinobacteria bacterium]|nr:hypothetical protein [Actinomycetota bacterium]